VVSRGFKFDLGASYDIAALGLLDLELDQTNASSQQRFRCASDADHTTIVQNSGLIAARDVELYGQYFRRPHTADWCFDVDDESATTGGSAPSFASTDPNTVAVRSVSWLGETVAAPSYWQGSLLWVAVEPFYVPLAAMGTTGLPAQKVGAIGVQEGPNGQWIHFSSQCSSSQKESIDALWNAVESAQPIYCLLDTTAATTGKTGANATLPAACRREQRGGVYQFETAPAFTRADVDPGSAIEWKVSFQIVTWQPAREGSR
jgi:hypothetical protein